jgi:hypothetical protein
MTNAPTRMAWDTMRKTAFVAGVFYLITICCGRHADPSTARC